MEATSVITLAEVAHLECSIPGISAAASGWLADIE
jgi:hypothetical protein